MMATSIAMSQPRLQDGARQFQMNLPPQRVGRLRQAEIVLDQRNDQLSVITHSREFHRLARAEAAGRVIAQRGELVSRRRGRLTLGEFGGHGSLLSRWAVSQINKIYIHWWQTAKRNSRFTNQL